MQSLLLVLIYQTSSGSGSFLATSIIPARHEKAIRLPCMSSRRPSLLVVCVLAKLSPLQSFYQPLGSLSAELSRGDFPPQTQEMGE